MASNLSIYWGVNILESITPNSERIISKNFKFNFFLLKEADDDNDSEDKEIVHA